MTPEEFKQQFQSRTVAYQAMYRADDRPVVLHLGDDAHTVAGHALLIGLSNQLARAHQHVVIVGADARPLLCPAVFGAKTVSDATLGLAQAINPFITTSNTAPTEEALVTIGIGQASGSVDVRVGCDGWLATFGPTARIGHDATSVFGGMLAATLAAAYAFHCLLATPDPPLGNYSLWDFGAEDGDQGPPYHPLDIGRVLQVGAGGVGSSLDFWLALVEVAGAWTIVDGDPVEVSNLNRQLSFLASDAGYPASAPINKAVASATLLGDAATADPHWYGETDHVATSTYDVVLALANERGVRSALQARQPTVLLHATTSANWEAQFHRHIAGYDDCISCRIPDAAPKLGCAGATVDADTGTDAALPFLSAAAGLLLLAALFRLQNGELTSTRSNFVSLNLKQSAPTLQHLERVCVTGCTRRLPAHARRAVASSTRYAELDPAEVGEARSRGPT